MIESDTSVQKIERKFDSKMSDEELQNIFTYHPPDARQRAIYEEINKQFLATAMVINGLIPSGPGKTVAIRKLAEARMQANACVALEGKF